MRFYDTFVQARVAVPKFIADSTHETEADEAPTRRSRIRPNRFLSSDSEEEVPIRKRAKISIPAPPPISIGSKIGKNNNIISLKSKPVKGLGLSKEEQKNKDKHDLMERLKVARAAAAAKLRQKSPQVKSSAEVSPWKVTPWKESTNSQRSDSTSSLFSIAPTPVKSPVGTPVMESYIDGDLLEVQIHEDDGSNQELYGIQSQEAGSNDDTPLITPVATPNSSPIQSVLPRSNALCLSPAGAKQFSEALKSRLSKSSESRAMDVESTQSSLGGRRQLFSAESKTPQVTLESMNVRLDRLEVQSRETASKADLILMNLGRLQRSLLPSEKRIVAPPNMPSLPLGTESELNKFEAFLKSADANLSGACDYFSSFIRSSVPDPERKSTHSILAHMLHNCLAKGINLEGGNGKIGFRGLQLYKVFLGTLQTAFPKSDLLVAENALQKWLKDAKSRKQRTVNSSTSHPF